MPMLAPRVALLKENSKMLLEEDFGEVFDADTGRPALAIKVDDVRIYPAPIPRGFLMGYASVEVSPIWFPQYCELTKESGRWVVTRRRPRYAS